MTDSLANKSILLIISGGIAAYKSLELIRLIRKNKGHVRCILTRGGAEFVTPLSVAALSEEHVYTDLWSLKDETEMGHIRLSREADLIVIAPASANIIAQMAHGLANDLASTTLLAADKPILIAPAMNHQMWSNPATQDNIAKLAQRGVAIIGPTEGDMACGEYGLGRMSAPEDILEAIKKNHPSAKTGNGLKAIVTAGPTFEPLDPVRFLGNHSSGKQGHAIASALSAAGIEVTYITGPTALNDPPVTRVIKVQTAQDMLKACENTLKNNAPVDVAVCAAAVSDWRPEKAQPRKLKKREDEAPPAITLTQNPDILHTISNHKKRPRLVIGFAAETENLIENAKIKRTRKGCDWILANKVTEKTFGADENHVFLITENSVEDWNSSSKQAIASTLTHRIKQFFNTQDRTRHAAE